MNSEMTLGQLIEKLEAEIAERQAFVALLRSMFSEATKGMGRPRICGAGDAAAVGRLIADGRTHRQIAKALKMPVASVGNLAKRAGAKRTRGDKRGGKRTR